MAGEKNNNNQEVTPAFLGLQSYTEAQAGSFFGREEEISKLTTLLLVNTLTIVFGKSGTGKTSLLNAGVFPRLRKNHCLPFRIRLEFNENSPNLVSQIKKVLKEEIDKYGFKVQSYPAAETLWEYFHKEPLWQIITPILVFDQFEEIFTLANLNPRYALSELPAFWQELSDIIENNIPENLRTQFQNNKAEIKYDYKNQKTKVVFAFREEYLPEFESITSKIPSIKSSRFRLMPMNGHKGYDVITKTWKEKINPSEAKKIVSYLINEQDQGSYDLVTIEPSLLSQVCAYLDKERISEGSNNVSAELLNKYPKETILRSIYSEAVRAADEALPANANPKDKIKRSPVKEFLEEKLITSEGFRTKYNLSGKEDDILPGIDVLINKYFIREDNRNVELTHDVLAPLIKTDREKRRKEIADRKTLRKAILLIGLPIILLALGFWGYAELQRRKAIEEKKIAMTEKKEAEIQRDKAKEIMNNYINALTYKKDSLEKEFLNKFKNNDEYLKEIKRLNDTIAALKKRLTDTTINYSPVQSDSIIKLNIQIEILRQDSAEKETAINLQKKRLNSADIAKDILNRQIDDLRTRIEALEKDKKNLEDQIRNLNDQINILTGAAIKDHESIRILRDSVSRLRGQILKLGETIQELMNRNPGSTFPGNLRIQVYDKSGEVKTPITKDTFLVYIVPNKGANEDILENNKSIVFMKDCDGFGKLLPKLAGWQKAYFKDGYYYFHDVIQNGRYKVKICNILDGYFDLRLPSSSGEVYWKQNEKQKIAIKLGRF